MRASGVAVALCLATLDLTGCATAPQSLTLGPAAALPSSTDRRQQLQQDIRAIVEGPGVGRGVWGIAVRALPGNERLVELNARTLLVPASVSKLISVAAAVDAVGWDYSFETGVFGTGPVVDGTLQGDLIVVGSGDPSIAGRGGADFAPWIEGLKAAGVRKIAGRIVGDDDRFEEPRPGAMWAWDDLGYTSGALFGALNATENRMTVGVTPGAMVGGQATLSVEPFAVNRPLLNRTVTGAPGSQQLLWPEQRPGETTLTIAGSIPTGAPPARLSVSVGNPTLWFVNLLRSRLEDAGIAVAGEAVDIDDLPAPPARADSPSLYSHRSPPLSEIAQPLLKESINLYAEAVHRLSAGASVAPTNDAALEAILKRLPAWGLEPDALQVVDGSGLSRRDAIAANTLVTVLARMYDPTWMSPWMRGLPIAGRDGTLVGRFRGTRAESNVRAKTGTMSNIRSLAGYLQTADGQPLAFAIIVNNFEGTGAQATAAIDAIAVRLANFTR